MTDWRQIAENLAEALKAGGDGYDALAAYDAAMAPPLPSITVTPGRYRFGGGPDDSVGVVLAVLDGKAYGYHESDGIPQGALHWSEDGQFGNGQHANMNLVERLPEGGTPQ